MRQNERLQQKLIDAKVRVGSLQFEKGNMVEQDREKRATESHSLREADQMISELTTALKRREAEMKIALDENVKLMHRYAQLEEVLQQKQVYIDSMQQQFQAELEERDIRLKQTQEQALTHMKQMKENYNSRSDSKART